MLFVLAILAAAIPAIAQSQSKQAKAPPALQSPAAETGLHFSVENRGLHSLSFNGQSSGATTSHIAAQCWPPTWRWPTAA
jgi:hypothetical protein